MENQISEERSLAETPTWSVATVTTVMVAVCFLVERSIYRFGMWLKKTKRKALLASLEKIKEELMLLGLISLMLGQWARWISEICMPSMLFSSRFYSCSEQDFQGIDTTIIDASVAGLNSSDRTFNLREGSDTSLIHCRAGHEPFVSYESLEQLHRFLFVLGITHVFYSCFAVVLAMIKIYSWRKWEPQANPMTYDNLQSRRNTMMKRQSTFIFHHASHPWSKNRILIWMLCFVRQFKSSIEKSDYMALRLGFISYHNLPLSYDFHKYMVRGMEDEFHGIVGISWPLWGYAILCIFINLHGLNIYFWLSFIPALLILLVGTKLQHVVAKLALEIVEATDPSIETQLRPRDDLFWFRKPELLLCLIQFISFQNAFEMAIFIWSLGGIKARSCFMKNRLLVVIRLVSGVLVQFWCSYSTVPLNVIITEMGSKFKKSLISESVRESLHDWCRRVKEKSKRESLHSHLGTTRSTCSLESTVDERDEIVTVVSGCLSRTSSMATQRSISLKCVNAASVGQETGNDISCELQCDLSLQLSDYSSSFPEDNVSLMVHPSTRSEIETDDD